jgi:hypothetical protein
MFQFELSDMGTRLKHIFPHFDEKLSEQFSKVNKARLSPNVPITLEMIFAYSAVSRPIPVGNHFDRKSFQVYQALPISQALNTDA